MKPAAPTRAVAYLRVSTDKQADHGVSLAAQESKVRAYAALYDLELVAVEVDAGLSACSVAGRPALSRALAMLGHGVDALLVVKLDRLTRNVADLGALIDKYFGPRGAALLSVSEQIDTRTSAGRLVLNVLASVAQWEREAIGERTSAALQHKRAQGQRVGSVPYGWADPGDGGPMTPVDSEQAVITLARSLRAQGLGFNAIGRELAARGHKSRTATTFQAVQVQRMLGHDSP